MTGKERFLTALNRGKPDCVPCTPDISNMVPCRLTGKPFWDIYLYNDPPLYVALLDALKKFDIDGGGFLGGMGLGPSKDDKIEYESKIIEKTDDRIVTRDTRHTPEGDLWQETVYWRDSPPTLRRMIVKDIEKDFRLHLKYAFPDPSECDDSKFQEWKKMLGDRGVATLGVSTPGFPNIIDDFDGGLEAITFAYYDHPELFEEYKERYEDWATKKLKRIIKAKPDVIGSGGSGSLTLQSPEIFRHLGLPFLKKLTKMAKEAGIPTMVHSCGRARELVRMAVEETDLSGINPLEVPPMGDCDLKELKQSYGTRICLMGNLHTIEVMQRGTVKQVEAAAKKAIDDAAEGGAFILATGDQCPGNTPYENILKMIEVARTYGKY
jgi:uroporphyrinogen decarboxylase